MQIQKTYLNSRLLAVFFLGFSSGLPLVLIGSTLQAWFTKSNISLATIGALSLLGIPYTLKFLWAPLMDYVSLPLLGKRRGWILLMQACLVLALLILASKNPATEAASMGIIALLIGFFSASQDIAFDAYRADILSADERGLGAAYYVFAYRIASLVSGGLALIAADYWGWQFTYELMAAFMLLSMLPAYLAPAVAETKFLPHSFFQMTIAALRDLLQRERILLLVLFIIFYKFGDALALQLMTNFLLHGLGFSLTEVGLAYKVVSIVAIILGALLGGAILTRCSLYSALLMFGLAQAFSNLMFVLLAMAGKHYLLMVSAIFIENFCSGLSTAAMLAFLMSLCNHQYTASQYALLSAIASLGRVFLGPIAAFMVEYLGWTQFYVWTFLLSFPGIFCLILLKDKVLTYAPAAD